MRQTRLPIVLLLTSLAGFPAVSAEHRVSSAAEIAGLRDDLKPGDTLVMANGNWTDQSIVFQSRGTAEKPITLRAQTPG